MAVGFKKFIKRCFRIIRSTVGLMLILVAYSFAGAALFRWLEGKHKAQEKAQIQQLRESIIDRVFYTSRLVSPVFFEKVIEDIGPYCGPTDTPCFGLLVTSAMGFKATWIPHLPALSPACNGFLSFTSAVIPMTITTGRERLIRSHSSARFCIELSGNSN